MIDIPDIFWLNLPLFVVGLAIIIKGSDTFLDTAVWFARAFGVPQIVIGATIVSVCTTLPELVSSSTAAWRGAGDMAIGNAIGSIIFNTCLILGVVLVCTKVAIRREIFLVKGVFMLAGLLVGLLLALPKPGETRMVVERLDGLVLLVLLGVFLVVNYYESLHAEAPAPGSEAAAGRGDFSGLWRQVGWFALGAVAVAVGAWLLVEFGQRLARNLGIKESVVSLVFVAMGTSLPELFTAIAAIRKRAAHVSVGNIFGANVLNMVLVVGASATIAPLRPRDQLLIPVDIPVALAACALAFGAGLFKGVVGRKTGVILLCSYVAYLASMVLLGRLGPA